MATAGRTTFSSGSEEMSDAGARAGRTVSFNTAGNSQDGKLTMRPTPSGRSMLIDPDQMVYKTSSLALLRARTQGRMRTEEHPAGEEEDPAHLEGAQRIVDFMRDMWLAGQLCDVIIQTATQELRAHKVALAAYSDVLAERFGAVGEGQVATLSLTGYNADTVTLLLRFVYTTEVHISDANIDALLGCSLDTGVTVLTAMCEDHLGRHTTDTALFYLSVAEKYGLANLQARLYHFVCVTFETIAHTTSFLHLSADKLAHLLADDNLVVSSELMIFHAVVYWVDFNRQERLAYAPQLVQCVRLQLIPPHLLITEVETVHYIFSIKECFNMLYQAIKYHALQLSGSTLAGSFPIQTQRAQTADGATYRTTLQTRPVTKPVVFTVTSKNTPQEPLLQSIARPRAYSMPANRADNIQQVNMSDMSSASLDNVGAPGGRGGKQLLAVAVGGVDLQSLDRDMPGKCVHKFDPQTNRWAPMTNLRDYTHHHGATTLNGLLYIVGGCVYDNRQPDMLGYATAATYCFDPSSRMWRVLPSMKEERAYLGLAAHGNRLFAVGGENTEKKKSDTVEYYDASRNSWSYLARMPHGGRIGAAVEVFRGQLWIVGGFNKVDPENPVLDYVDCFDLLQERWVSHKPLPLALCHAGLVEACGRLYLIGGRTKTDGSQTRISSLASILVYNEARDTWDHVTNMNIPRHDCGCATLGSKIFIVGGMKTPSPFCLASVECYDVIENRWCPDVSNLPYAAAGIACCTMEK